MGMSDGEFIILVTLLIAIVSFGAVVMFISDRYGATLGILTLNGIQILMLTVIMFKFRRKKNE